MVVGVVALVLLEQTGQHPRHQIILLVVKGCFPTLLELQHNEQVGAGAALTQDFKTQPLEALEAVGQEELEAR